MEKDHLINEIIFLPKSWHEKGKYSIYSLLKDSGYFEFYDQVKERDLHDSLLKNQECISHWIQWSEDKRVSSGWYITQKKGKYVVGFYPNSKDLKTTEYADEAEACAAFIKKEIEDIRNM
jgi:hypothetical protein